MLLYFCKFWWSNGVRKESKLSYPSECIIPEWFSVDEVFVKIVIVLYSCNFRKRVRNRKQNEQTEKKNFLVLFITKKYLDTIWKYIRKSSINETNSHNNYCNSLIFSHNQETMWVNLLTQPLKSPLNLWEPTSIVTSSVPLVVVDTCQLTTSMKK